jgi:arginyl-tRNA synthetase
VDLGLLTEPEELALVNALLDYPAVVLAAAEALEPHRVITYLHDTAELTHRWYHRHHVLGEPAALTEARLVLARATQLVLRNALSLLGISAPERM